MNLKNILLKITYYFSTYIIGEVNDVFVKLVKLNSDKVP